MSLGKSLVAGVIAGLLVAWLVGKMMLDNNNQGEFADTFTGEWTPHFWQMLALFWALGAIPVTGLLALIGLASKAAEKDGQA
jgi:ABC-type antimicrobial peptide transport system permease subunit